jgi:peptide/nickel transport system ATP-binding protein
MSKLIIKKLQIAHEKSYLVDINFEIKKATALIGESGSGKSLTLKSLLGMLPRTLHSSVDVESSFQLNHTTVSFVPQNPFTSLSPMTKIKDQFFCSPKKQRELLSLVNLEPFVLERFSSELSGGQLQRVIIAMALIKSPKLLLLDEPTTALDTQSKTIIIDLIQKLQQELGFYILFVTHDINSIADICEHLVIIKNGMLVELGDTKTVLSAPKDNYTKQLIQSGFVHRKFRT